MGIVSLQVGKHKMIRRFTGTLCENPGRLKQGRDEAAQIPMINEHDSSQFLWVSSHLSADNGLKGA